MYCRLRGTRCCPTAPAATRRDDAVRTLRLARELLDGHALTKLEVLGDPQTFYPNMPETIKAAEQLVREGFDVMVYCSDDPIQAQTLESIGCVAIMPLASLIGSGMGILNPWNIQLILEKAKVPVIVDAGVGTASDAAIAMELGCAGVLMNTAVAHAKDPIKNGRRHAQGGGSRARGVSRRSHAEETVQREPELTRQRRDRTDQGGLTRRPSALTPSKDPASSNTNGSAPTQRLSPDPKPIPTFAASRFAAAVSRTRSDGRSAS